VIQPAGGFHMNAFHFHFVTLVLLFSRTEDCLILEPGEGEDDFKELLCWKE